MNYARSRIKKEYPPGTFLPTPIRVLVIIQLCLAISLFLWIASQPFMGDLYHVRSEMLLYQDVMGTPQSDHLSIERKERLERNAQRFEQLPDDLKENIQHQYLHLQEKLQHTFLQKMRRLVDIFSHETSAFEWGWIFFSIMISILLLKKADGARVAVWLLPVITLCFLLENQMQKQSFPPQSLFPSENEIVQNYLNKPLSENILEQREQLLKGWNLYLIKNWTDESPSTDQAIFFKQAEKGEFMFNITQLQIKTKDSQQSSLSLFILCLYFMWNLLFAYINNLYTPIPTK